MRELAGSLKFGHLSGSHQYVRALRRDRLDVVGQRIQCAPGGSRCAPCPASSTQHSVCFSQFASSRSGKSSRACAPRLSVRFAAEWIVAVACSSRFSSSIVSTRSVFQISERSLDPHVGEGAEACARARRCLPAGSRRCGTPRRRDCIDLLHLQADLGGRARAIGVAQPVEARDAPHRRHPSRAAAATAPGLTIVARSGAPLRGRTPRDRAANWSRADSRRAPRRKPLRPPP